ncbi:transcription initiation factor IIF, beta subunit [Panaeolus papilionaceus]|nr:transcription initiation factor IIF, beta subunit [Panaeolus papilionaceus]
MDEVEDEKKPFDAAGEEEIAQPDPNEELMLEQGNGRIWLVKIPKFLLERWTAVTAEDAHLATLRVYAASPDKPNSKQRIILFLPPVPPSPNSPPQPQDPNRPVFDPSSSYVLPPAGSGAEPDAYELEMVNENVENSIVVAERPKDSSLSQSASSAANTTNARARTTFLTGRIKHECNLRPSFTESYRRQMKERHLKYNTPKRMVKRMEDEEVAGGRGSINRLQSGVAIGGNGPGFLNAKPKQAKGTFERMARMPRNALLDELFRLFTEGPRWSIKYLREKTQQPEVYLKEVLSEVAFLHKSGEHNGLWELKEVFREGNVSLLLHLLFWFPFVR